MALSTNNYIGQKEIIRKKERYLFPCSYHFYKNPPQIVRGKGTMLTDSEGKDYIDFFAGVSVMSCGHCNSEINSKVIEQLNTLQHTSSIYLTQPVVNLAEKMAGVLPGDIDHSFICNSGSEANEGAMLLARLYTKRPHFIALEGSLHGRTLLTSAATEIPMWRTDPFIESEPVSFAADADAVCRLIEEKGDSTAALILEPIQGNGGIRPLSDDFFDKVLPALRKKGILLIADEIQTGFGRTGRMFAIENWGITPDIITGAKALGNGYPIGFFASTTKIASCFTKPSASTLGGNPVSCTAAMAVLDYISENKLTERAAEMGKLLSSRLRSLSETTPLLSEPRGLGLMQGLEILPADGRDPAVITDIILEAMKDRGFFIGKNGIGRNVLAFQPPLIITTDEINSMADNLAEVVKQL